ncbi:hypothetical protein KAR91_38640 [Candidatus Pacearchaeota archaeon]|nr:hypothetical protein [Candidatus Pacearchaeota archaeon]
MANYETRRTPNGGVISTMSLMGLVEGAAAVALSEDYEIQPETARRMGMLHTVDFREVEKTTEEVPE